MVPFYFNCNGGPSITITFLKNIKYYSINKNADAHDFHEKKEKKIIIYFTLPKKWT